MTTLGAVSLDHTQDIIFDDVSRVLRIVGWQDTQAKYLQLKELFARGPTGTTMVSDIPGRKPIPVDHTEELRNTQYCIFSASGFLEAGSEPQDGWYLLTSFRRNMRGITKVWNFIITLRFIGTEAEYQPAFGVYDSEDVTNDWSI